MMSKLVLVCIAATAVLGVATCSPEVPVSAETPRADTDASHAELQSVGDDYIDAVTAVDPLLVYFGFAAIRLGSSGAYIEGWARFKVLVWSQTSGGIPI